MEIEGKSKYKILYLLEILEKESDDEHKLSMKSIQEKLEKRGIKAERKSISRDIKLLCDYGYDIISYGENREGYFMASRNFNVSELRLLIDAVLSAKFISVKQSRELVDKLKLLTSKDLAKKLENQLYIDERIKTNNEYVYENVDKLNEAISLNNKISFKYYKYTLEKNFVACADGKLYIRSPYSLAWHDDKYYMICGHNKYDNLGHYRVDRMRKINILDEPRRNFNEVCDYKNNFDTGDYLNRVFNMFTGEEETVKIRFHKDLINFAIDQFGEDVSLQKIDNEHFEVMTQVMVSDGFISWIMQLGSKAEIVYPQELRNRIKEIIVKMNSIY
ncbi:MAG: hypothetical protein K0R54_3586 [Clostridiaceae bacterium]|nr:hypothetical protein [Clostridiaceae bacterium]